MYEMLAGRVNSQLTTLDSTVKIEIPKVNTLLKRQKLAEIKAEPAKPDEKKDEKK